MKVQESLSKLISDMTPVLPERVIGHLWSLFNAGEFILAFEELCAYIGEADYKVGAERRQLIEQLGNKLAVDPKWWKGLP